jgi:hypothetical protein
VPSDEELFAIKDRAVEQLFRIPGVPAVGLGGRIRDGRPTGETVLKVFVSEKKPLADLGPDAVVPGESEGVPTDVVVMGDLEPDVDPVPGRVEPSVEMLDDTRRRPLVGGAQLQVDLVGSGLGTLGCFVVEKNDETKAYALTNSDVISTDLCAELARLRAALPDVAGMTYPQILDALDRT